MTEQNGVGVTIISHNSESRTHVQGCEPAGCYSRDINYNGASLSQVAILTNISSHCEQFIKYESHGSMIFRKKSLGGWWVSRDSKKMTHLSGASGNDKCACGMTNSCADPSLTRKIFQLNSSGLEKSLHLRKVITLSGNSNAMEQHDLESLSPSNKKATVIVVMTQGLYHVLIDKFTAHKMLIKLDGT